MSISPRSAASTPATTPLRGLVFVRVDGALAHVSAVGCASWIAARQADMGSRLTRWATLATGPKLLGDLLGDATAATHLAWAMLSGCSEDRLEVLMEDWHTDVLMPALRSKVVGLLREAQDRGLGLVLLSALPRRALGTLPDRLGALDVVCNTLQVVPRTTPPLTSLQCTGKLISPVITGRFDGGWVRAYAADHGLAPRQCFAYGHRADDAVLLSGVGHPCAVQPVRALRRLADELDWPVLLDS